MSEHADEERVTTRAELLPEEKEAGSADPQRQAEAILAESDERTADPGRVGGASSQTSSPEERPDG